MNPAMAISNDVDLETIMAPMQPKAVRTTRICFLPQLDHKSVYSIGHVQLDSDLLVGYLGHWRAESCDHDPKNSGRP